MYLCDQGERVFDAGCAGDQSIHCFCYRRRRRETAELTAALNTWDKARRFVVSRVLKDEKDRKQLSFLESEAYDYFFFVTNKTELLPEEVVEFYEKHGIWVIIRIRVSLGLICARLRVA